MLFRKGQFLYTSLITSALADTQYKSRPDLSPPKLNITIPAGSNVAEGYLFLGPYSGFAKGQGLDGPEQQAGYIFRDDGDLVWSSLGHLAGWIGNMQVSSLGGQPVLSLFEGTLDAFHGHGFGHPTILNRNYERIHHLRGGNHKVISIHEFNVQDAGAAMIEVFQPTQMDLSPFGGNESHSWIANGIFQELDIKSNAVLFEWDSLTHVSPHDSAISLPSGHAGDGQNSTSAWDYFHINSVDKDRQGNYLISARHASALYKIDGTTGRIIWQLGGKKSNFNLTDDVLFGFQHDARFWTPTEEEEGVEYVSIFDNAARANGHRGGGVEIVHSKSRAKVVRLDTNLWEASIEVSLAAPGDILAPSQGNVQRLSNGNLFVNWGQGGAITEYLKDDGKVLFHAMLDSGETGECVQSYRGFRFPWHGFPMEDPAMVVETDAQGKTSLFVSWNGDTETVEWHFYTTTKHCYHLMNWFCKPERLGIAKRRSFETVLDLSQSPSDRSGFKDNILVFAQAVDKTGKILGSSKKILLEGQNHPWQASGVDESQTSLEL